MKRTNPLPGMNPFLEVRWSDAHTKLIAYVSDSLSEDLPDDLTIVAEESLSVGTDDQSVNLRADVAIVGQAELQMPEPLDVETQVAVAPIAKPKHVEIPVRHRWLEIRTDGDELVTVIEILSPCNKTAQGSQRFILRQSGLIDNGINVVDIDLLRGGTRTVGEDFIREIDESDDETIYLISVARGGHYEARDFYHSPLRQRLPVIGIPLRSHEADIALDLQPLIDRCYRTGRYWQVSQRVLPGPTLPPAEQQWLGEQLAASGFESM